MTGKGCERSWVAVLLGRQHIETHMASTSVFAKGQGGAPCVKRSQQSLRPADGGEEEGMNWEYSRSLSVNFNACVAAVSWTIFFAHANVFFSPHAFVAS